MANKGEENVGRRDGATLATEMLQGQMVGPQTQARYNHESGVYTLFRSSPRAPAMSSFSKM
jgi:hypothetical protein